MAESIHLLVRRLARTGAAVRARLFPSLVRSADGRVHPSITRSAREGLHGYVEDFGPTGIRGWLLDLAACDAHLKVDAFLGGHFLGRGHAVRHRPDISKIVGRPVHCEFLIACDTGAILAAVRGLDPSSKMRIRVAALESGREIMTADDAVRTVGELLEYARAASPSA